MIPTALKSSRAIGLYDQALASLVTFGQTLVYARTLDAGQFGLFAMVLAALLVGLMVQRAVVVLPMIVAQSEQSEPDVRAWWRLNLVITALTLAVVMTIALAGWLWAVASTATVLILCKALVMALPSLLAFEFARRVLYTQERSMVVLRMSIANSLFQVGAVAVVVVVGGQALAAVGGMAVAAGCAAVLGLFGVSWRGQETHGAQGLLVRYRKDMGWNLAAALPYAGFNTAMPMLLGFLSGPATAGVFTATRLLVSPVTALIAAVDSVDKPRAARSLREGGASGLRRSLGATLSFLIVFGGVYLVLAGAFADEMLNFLLGPEYPLPSGSAQWWAVVGFLIILAQPLETGLLVLRRTKWFFWTRMGALLAAMLLLHLTLGRLGYEAGIVAMAAGWLVSGLAAAALLRWQLQALRK